MKLVIVEGPTAVGKTAYAINLARQWHTEIISCDSRQCYQELVVGVARPSADELAAVRHHFIACRSIHNPYNVYTFEQEALARIELLSAHHDILVAVGGSNLYIDALCNGIAILPDPTPELRQRLKQQLASDGIASLQQQLLCLDPAYYDIVDRQNPARLQRALEVCHTTGRPYSEILQEQHRSQRPFEIEHIVLQRTTSELRKRIGQRVEQMMADGLSHEAEQLQRYSHLTPLNTVGYKEFYEAWRRGENDIVTIAETIKTNTWHYAKKQLTWLKKKQKEQACTLVEL